MRIAFVILAHKYPEHILRLVNVLSEETDHFFIHIDKRSPSVFTEVQHQVATNPRVFLTNNRHACRWGQFSIVSATLSCLQEICTRQDKYDYVVLLSGQDYPIKPLSAIKHYLKKHQGQQFMEAFSFLEANKWSDHEGHCQPMRRVFNWHFFLRSKHLHIPLQRKIPNSLVPYGGAQWWALTQACVEHIVQYAEANHHVVNYFKYTLAPDEIFFQTLVCNSPFKADIAGYSLTYTDWENPNPFPPRVLNAEDIEPLKNSNLLFARKFDPQSSEEVLNFIDRVLLNNTVEV